MDPQTKSENQTAASISEAEMEKYGITRTVVHYFHYQNFKYSNLNDALAQARKNEEKS